MYVLEVEKEDIEEFCSDHPIGDRIGLNISVVFNNKKKRLELVLALRTEGICGVMVFDDPLEVEGLISSLKEANEAMDMSLNDVN